MGVGLTSPATILAFISWFGGVGYQARHALGVVTPVSLLFGVVAGLIGAAIVWWFLAKVILPHDIALDPEDFRLPGTIGRVTSSIGAGGTGEIVYEQAGVRQVSAARVAGGAPLPRASEVVVRSYERGIALVESLAVPTDDQSTGAIGRFEPTDRPHPVDER